MFPDLEQFDGQRPSRILRLLREDGYEVIGAGLDSVVLARPGEDIVIRMTNFADQAQAFVRLCEKYPGNKHLPEIYASRRIEGDPPLFITVMERLDTLDQIPEDKLKILGGFARAFALLVEGHKSHDEPHGELMKKHDIAQAALGIIDALASHLETADKVALYYDSGFTEKDSVETWYPDNVLFRPHGDGKWDIVFTDPFRERHLKNEEQRVRELQILRDTRARLENLAKARPRPAAPAFSP